MAALRRSRLADLPAAECWSLLGQHQYGVGRIAVGGAVPTILPVNYLVDGRTVVVQVGEGSILDAARDGAWLAFEIDSLPSPALEGHAEAWSVLVKGPSRVVADGDDRAFLRLTRLDPQAGGFKPEFVAIDAAEVTGRRRR